MITLPETFKERMQQMLGRDYPAFLQSFENPFRNGIRCNPLKNISDILTADLKPVPWNPNGYYIDDKKKYSSNPLYHAGAYYIQEASAMLPAQLADARPGEKILDLCAAPGGKSTAVGAALQGQGLLISNDISRTRAKALLHNIEVFGITNAAVISEYPDKLTSYFPDFFDKILIDAPCSGEGMFHKEPSMVNAWMAKGPEEYHKIQKEILQAADKMLRPGGRLIYSTCTFSPVEDEGSISWFLDQYPEYYICDIRQEQTFLADCLAPGRPEWGNGDPSLACAFRVWPHLAEGEGHFAVVLQKGNPLLVPTDKKKKKTAVPKKNRDLEAFFNFLDKEKIHWDYEPERLVFSKGYVRYVPEGMPELPGVHILRSGLFLGEIKKGRFEPSTAFARALQPEECKNVIRYPADGTDILRYLKCETLSVDQNLPAGWYLICADDCPLGWAKVQNGTLKNKYPPGWRIL